MNYYVSTWIENKFIEGYTFSTHTEAKRKYDYLKDLGLKVTLSRIELTEIDPETGADKVELFIAKNTKGKILCKLESTYTWIDEKLAKSLYRERVYKLSELEIVNQDSQHSELYTIEPATLEE